MIRVVWLFFALLALAPGCASEPRTILVWHSYRNESERALEELARTFEHERGVHVELLGVPFDAFAAKLEAAVPRDHGPDVFIDAHERLGSYLRARIVAPAGDAFLPEDEARFQRTSLEATSIVHAEIEKETLEQYGVPLETKCVALYLSNELAPRDPRTLEEITGLALPKGTYPLVYEAQDPYFHAPILSAFFGQMLDGDQFGLVGPEAFQSVEQVRAWTRAGVIPEEPSGALVVQLFSSGKAAAAISGPWLAADLGDRVRYRVAPLPPLGGHAMRPLLTVDAAWLTPRGAKSADARAFARFLGSTESAITRALVGKQIVADQAAWSDPRVAKDPVLARFHEAAATATPMPTSPRMRAVWVPAQEAIRRALREPESPAEPILEEARRRFDDAVAPPPPPPSPAPLAVALGVVLLALAAATVRRARDPELRARVRSSAAAYAYVAHAALVVGVLVVLPLAAGALTSLFAGSRDAPQYVGLGNYVAILTARGGPLLGHGSFWLTLLVTILWTALNVSMHVAIGLTLGVLLARPWLRLRAIYRVLLVLPWAVPSYVTALAWKGMFHRQFGAINAILALLGAPPVSWFGKFSTALTANVATNVWLGFPFMMVVTMGALTSIPKEVLEAAEVDGATRWQRFRLVTLPLLRPALLPSVVLGAVWTFNMFNVVFLVSGGEPDGQTDILVSEAYRWAFTRDAQYGYAAAYAVLIFLLLFGTSRAVERLQARTA